MQVLKTISYKGYTIKVTDADVENPIHDWDMLGTFSCFHNNYDLSSKDNTFTDKDDLLAYLERKDVISLPIYIYDHSGITVSTTPFQCRWDSGKIGYIHVTRKKALLNYGKKRMTEKLREKVLDSLRSEVGILDDYVTGNVYGFRIEDKDGNDIDSCTGYFGEKGKADMIEEAKSIVDNESPNLKKNNLILYP